MSEIKVVNVMTRVSGDYAILCPHCNSLMFVEGKNAGEVRGGQYRHIRCDRWVEVSEEAKFSFKLGKSLNKN